MKYIEVDIYDDEMFQKCLTVLNYYTCLEDHLPLYIEGKIKHLYEKYNHLDLPIPINIRLFYRNEDGIESVIGTLNDNTNRDMLIVWAHEKIGADSQEDLDKEYRWFSEHIVDLLKTEDKHYFRVNVRWSEYKPHNRLENGQRWLGILNKYKGVYFEYNVEPNEYMTFKLVE